MIYEQEVHLFNEDALKSRFHSISTQFDVTLGKISAIVSDSDIQEYLDGHTTMNTKLSSVVQDVNGISTQVSSMTTLYDGEYNFINSRLTKLDTTINGITASVSSSQFGGLTGDTVYYLASASKTNVTTSTSGWSTSVPTLTSTNKYLWMYHNYSYSGGATYKTSPVIVGEYSASGPTISAVTPIRYMSNSTSLPTAPSSKVTSTSTSTATWTKAFPTSSGAYIYLYGCDQIEYSNGTFKLTDIIRFNALVGLENRVSAAELKITDNAIVSTVRSSQAYQGDLNGVKNATITSDTIHYLATSASSGVTTSTSGWTTTVQSMSPTNKYLWTYHTYTYGDNTTSNTTPVITGTYGEKGDTGSKGDKGDTGVSISSVTNYYLATSASSGVTTSTSGWTTSIQSMTSTNQYLWNYEVIKGSDNSTISTTTPVIIGRYGQNGTNGTNGKGISSITEYYAVNNSTSAPADSAFGTSVVSPTSSNKYLWNYEVITYTDSSTTKTSKRIIGTYGEKGTNGDDGNSVIEIKSLYYASNSSGSAPSLSTSSLPITSTSTSTATWTTVVPTMTSTHKYIWTCDQVKYSDNTYTITNIVLMTKAIESVIEQTADSIRLRASNISWESTYSSMTSAGELTCTSGNIGGIVITSDGIYGRRDVTSGTASTQYLVKIHRPATITSTSYAISVQNRYYDGSAYGNWTSQFYVRYDGRLYASDAIVKGEITATSGYIGTSSDGFTINSSAIYNGISSASASSGTGIYLGTNGINLGGGKFKVSTAGALTSTSGTIGGFTITSNSIYRGTNSVSSATLGDVYLGVNGINIGGVFSADTSGNAGFSTNLAIIGNITDVNTITATGISARSWIVADNKLYAGGNTDRSTSSVTYNLNVNGSGNGYFVGGVSYAWATERSDRKLKDHIKPIKKAKELIMALKPRNYMLKDGNHLRTHMGFIAQEVSDIEKELGLSLSLVRADYTGKDEQFVIDNADDSELLWSLSYTELIAPLVKVIQEQESDLQKLMERVEMLERTGKHIS